MNEEWRPVPGLEDRYHVSSLGRVYSVRQRKTMALQRGPKGHHEVDLWTGDKHIRRVVHVLMLLAFVGPRPPGMTDIRHLDGNPDNNTLSNLRYGTRAENAADCIRHGRNHALRRTHCPSGHPYDESNIYSPPSRPNARYCRACHRARYSASNAGRRAAQ